MRELRHPNVFIEEASFRPRAVVGVDPSAAVFVGTAQQGPCDRAERARSVADFSARFGAPASPSDLGVAAELFFANGGADAWFIRVQPAARPHDFISALQAIDGVDSFGLLALPGVAQPEVLLAAFSVAVRRRAFLLVDAPAGEHTPADLQRHVQTAAWIANGDPTALRSAALYYPWLHRALAPGLRRSIAVPPSGAVAGIVARIDRSRGVWKAPAGQEAEIRGISGLARTLNESELGELNRSGINSLRASAVGSPVVWGARTLRGADAMNDEFKYIPVRRLALFVEESVRRGIAWAVFEPASEALWARLRQAAEEFLLGLFLQGAFPGRTPQEAFFVRCGRDTTTQADLGRGVVHLLLGVAPVRPAEFITLRLEQRFAV